MSSTRDTDAKTLRLFDVRTIERNIKKGQVTTKDYEKHLKSLPDTAEKVAPIEEHRGVDDLDDDDDDILEADDVPTT
jgi:hypothetical protein